MSPPRLKPQRWTAWLSAWVILLGALAPSVSHWLQASSGQPNFWAEICSARADAQPPQDAQGKLTQGDVHCPFCLPHGGSAALPPSPPLVVPVLALTHAEPLLFLHAPQTLFAWAPGQARAPPVALI